MNTKECINNVGGQHIHPLDALAAVSALSDEFLDPLARFTFVRTLIDIRRSYRKRIDTEIVNAWKVVAPNINVLQDITLITNAENQQVYRAAKGVLTRSKTEGGSGYCDDCAGSAITYFCTLPWLKKE